MMVCVFGSCVVHFNVLPKCFLFSLHVPRFLFVLMLLVYACSVCWCIVCCLMMSHIIVICCFGMLDGCVGVSFVDYVVVLWWFVCACVCCCWFVCLLVSLRGVWLVAWWFQVLVDCFGFQLLVYVGALTLILMFMWTCCLLYIYYRHIMVACNIEPTSTTW